MDALVNTMPPPAAKPARAAPTDWVRLQRVNLSRHSFGLAPFQSGDFGEGVGSPSQAHLSAVNVLLERFGKQIRHRLDMLRIDPEASGRNDGLLTQFARLKDRGQQLVEVAELLWDFYYQLFGQRQSRLGGRLLASDRIALDCYQKVYTGLGKARSIPTPPPFSFMAAGGGPATFRRGIPVPQLGRIPNPFPLIQLPHHRLLNPWTLGAIAHEVSHNLQSDLGLWQTLPREIQRRIRKAGGSANIAKVWSQWHAEMFSDLAGILFIGPAMVSSLIGVLARAPARVARFDPGNPHPPSLLRVPISLFLLERLGFRDEARVMSRLWNAIYSPSLRRCLPSDLTANFEAAAKEAIGALVYTPYPELGHKRLVDVVTFETKEQQMTLEAARRLAAGTDPGIVPERFLIGASRIAVEQRLAPPGRIALNFYKALERR